MCYLTRVYKKLKLFLRNRFKKSSTETQKPLKENPKKVQSQKQSLKNSPSPPNLFPPLDFYCHSNEMKPKTPPVFPHLDFYCHSNEMK